jgi:hypothetical protein
MTFENNVAAPNGLQDGRNYTNNKEMMFRWIHECNNFFIQKLAISSLSPGGGQMRAVENKTHFYYAEFSKARLQYSRGQTFNRMDWDPQDLTLRYLRFVMIEG